MTTTLDHRPSTERFSSHDPAGLLVQAALERALARLSDLLPSAERCEPEGVHQMRTASRRLRGELKAFGELLADDGLEPLAEELKGLSGTLGAVRDLDVLSERLRAESAGLGSDLAPLDLRLQERREAARKELRRVLAGEAHRDLLAQLAEAAAAPPTTEQAHEPCADVLPGCVRHLWKKLEEAGSGLGPDDPDPAYHEVRKRAKAVRHAAEAVAPALGHHASADAERFARRAKGLQDRLGEHQDFVMARKFVEETAASHPTDGPFNLAAGRLIERLSRQAQDAREAFPALWAKLDRKKNLRWLND